MIPHLSIGPSGGPGAALADMLARASLEPRAFATQDAADRHTLVFCETPDLAVQQQRHLESGGLLSAGICTVEIDPFGLRVSQDGTAGAREALRGFLQWLLEAYAPCRVWDEDTGREVTDFSQIG